tara:strand:- start:1684 stop:2364 length:681 start_codon:yes stop_codon:yes gene_type:complete
MNKRIIIIGGEGNGGVVAACIEDMRENYSDSKYEVLGFLNDFELVDRRIKNYPIMGKTETVKDYFEDESILFMYAIHPVGHGSLRIGLFEKIGIPEEKLATVIHPSAFVANNTKIEPGVMIMSNCYVGPAACIKKCALVMANSIVGHNTTVGAFCHLSAGSVTSSYVELGTASDVALNATVVDKVKIGKYAVVGAGAMVIKDVNEEDVVVGNPARVIRKASDKERY